jgi:hypothetical protein
MHGNCKNQDTKFHEDDDTNFGGLYIAKLLKNERQG